MVHLVVSSEFSKSAYSTAVRPWPHTFSPEIPDNGFYSGSFKGQLLAPKLEMRSTVAGKSLSHFLVDFWWPTSRGG